MEKEFIFTVNKDITILCDLYNCQPAQVLQFYADSISLTAYLSAEPAPIAWAATNFFLHNSPTLDTKAMKNYLEKSMGAKYYKELLLIADREVIPANIQRETGATISKWRYEAMAIRTAYPQANANASRRAVGNYMEGFLAFHRTCMKKKRRSAPKGKQDD